MSDPRYVASLQDVSDLSCYKDFFEGNKLYEAKEKADEAAEKHQRSAIVFDRQEGIVYKNEKKFTPVPVKAEPVLPVKKQRKKKEEPTPEPVKTTEVKKAPEPVKKSPSKDDYF